MAQKTSPVSIVLPPRTLRCGPGLLGGAFDDDDGTRVSDETTGDAAILMKEFGIDPAGPLVPRWMALAQGLAEKYHPDYRKPPGRPKHKTVPYYAMLLGNIEYIRETHGLRSNKEALRWLYDNAPSLLTSFKPSGYLPSFDALYTDFKTARSYKRSGVIW